MPVPLAFFRRLIRICRPELDSLENLIPLIMMNELNDAEQQYWM